MPFACHNVSSSKAVKLIWPKLIRTCTLRRPFSLSSRLYEIDNPDLHPPGVLGTFAPTSTPNIHARDVAVIGGGITGLAAAFHLSRDLPHAKITLYEEKNVLGGWVDSEQVDVQGGTALFEWGPRTLRPDPAGNGFATLELMCILGQEIVESIRAIPKTQPAATNRYIYYPDHLVRMPAPDPNAGIISNLFNTIRPIVTEPIFKGVFSSVIAEPSVACRADNVRDESVGDFVRRRFGKTIADNLLSALFHGIYAGDIYKLSVRTLMPHLWYLENRDRDGNGVLAELTDLFFKGHALLPFEKLRYVHQAYKEMSSEQKRFIQSFLPTMARASVYTFPKGLGQLASVLIQRLERNPKITIKTGSEVSSIDYSAENHKVQVKVKGSTETSHDYVVHTLSPASLKSMLDEKPALTGLANRVEAGSPPTVNVMVVNLYYSQEHLPIPRGFGYLLPRSIPADQNPERALGVIFASETSGPRGEQAFQMIKAVRPRDSAKSAQSSERDPTTPESIANSPEDYEEIDVKMQVGQDTAPGSKLAVMLGGHWWDGWTESDLPSEEEAISMAKSVISRQLGIDFEPEVAKARLQRNCIPQFQVGYRDHMARIHDELIKGFHGRLKVGGTGWQGGVGLNDCVRSARDASRSIREGWDDETGLKKYKENEKWVLVEKRSGRQLMDPLQR